MATSPLVFHIPTPGASYTVTGDGGFTDSGTVGTNGLSTTAANYPQGLYNITYSYKGATVNDEFSIGPESSNIVYFNPVPLEDPGTTGGASSTSSAAGAPAAPSSTNPLGPQAALASAIVTPVPAQNSDSNYPFSWPAYNYGKYFTPTQAFLYIGDMFIDELSGFQFTLQANKVPVFGYASTFMDAIGTGKSLVQGQLTINFISEGYLYTVLDQYAKQQAQPQAADELAAINLAQQIVVLQNDPTPAVQSQIVLLKQGLSQLLATNSKLPNAIAAAMKGNGKLNPNAAYKKVPFDIVMQFEGGDRTVTRKISKCVLTGNEQVLGENDSITMDGYSFLARSLD